MYWILLDQEKDKYRAVLQENRRLNSTKLGIYFSFRLADGHLSSQDEFCSMWLLVYVEEIKTCYFKRWNSSRRHTETASKRATACAGLNRSRAFEFCTYWL